MEEGGVLRWKGIGVGRVVGRVQGEVVDMQMGWSGLRLILRVGGDRTRQTKLLVSESGDLRGRRGVRSWWRIVASSNLVCLVSFCF